MPAALRFLPPMIRTGSRREESSRNINLTDDGAGLYLLLSLIIAVSCATIAALASSIDDNAGAVATVAVAAFVFVVVLIAWPILLPIYLLSKLMK